VRLNNSHIYLKPFPANLQDAAKINILEDAAWKQEDEGHIPYQAGGLPEKPAQLWQEKDSCWILDENPLFVLQIDFLFDAPFGRAQIPTCLTQTSAQGKTPLIEPRQNVPAMLIYPDWYGNICGEQETLRGTMKQELLDTKFMSEAVAEARKASLAGEVPVGAVVVLGDEIIARAYNCKESDNDPTAHAEILAIREAARHVGAWRLSGATIYVTLEPCPMCAGAIVQARLDRLVYGAADPKTGAAGTIFDIPRDLRLNHWVSVTGGVMAEEAGTLLEEFFANRR
jgi:tRNA(adenine34) deaminase